MSSPKKKPKKAPEPLSREAIVRAALAIADRDGIAGVSLRNVAAALDAGPMRIYTHLSTKEDLLAAMIDAVYAEIERFDGRTPSDWRGALRSLAHRIRRAAHRHPWFVELLEGRPHPEVRARSLTARQRSPR